MPEVSLVPQKYKDVHRASIATLRAMAHGTKRSRLQICFPKEVGSSIEPNAQRSRPSLADVKLQMARQWRASGPSLYNM